MMNYGLGNAMMGGSARDGAPQGIGGAMGQPQQPPQQQSPMPGGIHGLLAQLLMGGGIPGLLNRKGIPSPLGMGAAGQLGGLLGGLFKK